MDIQQIKIDVGSMHKDAKYVNIFTFQYYSDIVIEIDLKMI